jgi:hypothetical protein
LDFFGVAVRAQELLLQCTHMRLLHRKVTGLMPKPANTQQAPGQPPHRSSLTGTGAFPLALTPDVVAKFKLEAMLSASMPQPKWGKLLNWGPADDATLLLGKMHNCLM